MDEEKGEVRGLKRETDAAFTHTLIHTQELVWFLDYFLGLKLKRIKFWVWFALKEHL